MNINLVFEFLKAFLGAFYDKGIGSIFWGFLHIFYNEGYADAFKNYTEYFGAGEWAVAIIFIILIVAVIVAIIVLIALGIRKLARLQKPKFCHRISLKSAQTSKNKSSKCPPKKTVSSVCA